MNSSLKNGDGFIFMSCEYERLRIKNEPVPIFQVPMEKLVKM